MGNVSQKLFNSLGQAHEFELAMIKQQVTSAIVQDVIDGKLSLSFAPVSTPTRLNFKQLLSWLRKNKLDSKLAGGLEGQFAKQEIFYQQFYGKSFSIDRKNVFIDVQRLVAIKAGLRAGSINYALLKATPKVLSEAEAQMTEVEFFFRRLIVSQKKDGFKIWAENGTDRWTNLTLLELLQRSNLAEPEEFDAGAFQKDWVREEVRALEEKGASPKVRAGIVELTFTSNLTDIPSNQVIVNKGGEIVTPDDRSYVSAIAKNVRVLSSAEGIILESQLFAKDKTYLAPNTWEWRRDLIDHRDKGTSQCVSVALVGSGGSGFMLGSLDADGSDGSRRLRLAL